MHPTRIASTLLAATLVATRSAQQVVFVNALATGANSGASWQDAFVDLQSALAVASTPFEVWVAQGTYFPSTSEDPLASFALHSGVALYGGFAGSETARWQRNPAALVTVLSGDFHQDDQQGSGLYWYATAGGYLENTCQVVTATNVDSTAVLDGFTIEHGAAFDTLNTPNHVAGAGLAMTNSSPTVINCTFRHCMSYWGGGAVDAVGGSPTFRSCRFEENYVTDGWGGGIALACPTVSVTDCNFLSNTGRCYRGGAGGAMYIDFNTLATVRGCSFYGNECRTGPTGGLGPAFGGGIYSAGNNSVFDRCSFILNGANGGGGLCLVRSGTVTNSLFNHNVVYSWGGLAGDGGGLQAYAYGSTINVPVSNCTFVNGFASDNGGGAYFVSTTGQVQRCVFWNNTDTSGQIGRSQCRGANPRYSCVQNLLVGEPGEDPPDPANLPGSIDQNPQFVDADGANNYLGDEDDDLHLLPSSPCIDAVPANQTATGQDLFGLPRMLDGDGNQQARLDMGASEFGLGQLSVETVQVAPNIDVTIRVTGVTGSLVVLGIGSPGAETQLLPFGAYYFNLGQAVSTYALAAIPAVTFASLPPINAQLQMQAFVIGANGSATFTNPVRVTL